MDLKQFNISTFPLNIPKRSPIDSDELNGFTSAVAEDIAQLQDVVNNVVDFMSTLPSDVDPETDSLDGTTIAIDSAASTSKDGGIFYDSDNSKPLSIYQSMLLMMQILANMENGLREGVKVGSITSPISTPQTYSWPYTDCMFEPIFFTKSGSTVTKASDMTISVNSTNKTITITPVSSIWGYLWHPVLTF